MGTRVAQVLEHHARALSSLKVDNPRGVSGDRRLDFEDRSKDACCKEQPPRFGVGDDLGKDFSTMSVAFPAAYFSRFSANVALIFRTAFTKSVSGGRFRQSRRTEFIDSAMFEVTCPYLGIGKKARTLCSLGISARSACAVGEIS